MFKLDNRTIVGLLIATNFITYAMARTILAAYENQKNEYKKLHDMFGYLVHVLEDHDVDLSEFDMAALNILSVDSEEF